MIGFGAWIMEKKIFAVAVALAMSMEFLGGNVVMADSSRFYRSEEGSIEYVDYDDSVRNDRDDSSDSANKAVSGDAVFNPYVFSIDDRNEVSASVVINSDLAVSEVSMDAQNVQIGNLTIGDVANTTNATGFNITPSISPVNTTGYNISPVIVPVDTENITNENDTIISNSTRDKTPIDDAAICVAINATEDQLTYTGYPITPDIVVYFNSSGVKLRQGVDYNVTFSRNVNAGQAAFTIDGLGYYNSTRSGTFTIGQESLSSNTSLFIEPERMEYTGFGLIPGVIVLHKGDELAEGEDYNLTYVDNEESGEAYVIAQGIGNYKGEVNESFTIIPAELNSSSVIISGLNRSFDYTGKDIEPDIDLFFTSSQVNRTLEKGTDYNLSFLNNRNAGRATVRITGKGNFTGNLTDNFEIDRVAINRTDISFNGTSFVYHGSPVKPAVTVQFNGSKFTEGVDYNVTYSSNNRPGTGKVTVAGMGNVYGEVTLDFNITSVEYTISFDANGGSGVMSPITVQEGEGFTVPGCEFDAPVGKFFDTWDVAPVGTNMTVSGNMTFTAQWKENTYPVINGSDTWPGEDGTNITVEIDAPISEFLYAECDGNNLTVDVDCIVTEGSTIVTLTDGYLKTLAPGVHTLTAYFTDGKTVWTFTISGKESGGGSDSSSDSPQTSQPVSPYVTLFAVVMSIAALGGVAYIVLDESKKRLNR